MSDNAEPQTKQEITFDDFAKVDLRVAKVLACEPHPQADRLLRLELDDGSGTPRQICAGVREYYQPESLVGRHIVIVSNLAPRTIRGVESRGMLLAASEGDKGTDGRKVVLCGPWDDIAPGSTVS